MNLLRVFSLIFLCLFLLPGCGGEDESSQPRPDATQASAPSALQPPPPPSPPSATKKPLTQEEIRQQNAMIDTIRHVGLAIANHESASRHFPNDICDSQGKPLLSWRVRILEYLWTDSEVAPDEQFELDEPWDSPHNIQLLNKAPKVLMTDEEGKTRILGFDTELSPTGTKGRGIRVGHVTDGIENTLAFVMVGPEKAVPWTKPEDVAYDPNNTKANLGDVSNGFYAVYLDVHPELLPANISTKKLNALITFAGGEKVDE